MQKKTLTVLGNCVAERLLLMLHTYPGFSDAFDIKRFRIIPHIHQKDLKYVAKVALECDVILSQPLFSYGPCNTSEIRKKLKPHQELIVFSSPDFPAYFPELRYFTNRVQSDIPKPLEWDSQIIFSCYVNKVPLHKVEKIYTSHWFFHKDHMLPLIDKSIESYIAREQGVDLSTLTDFIKHFRQQRLFHSPRHPILPFIENMCTMLVDALGLKRTEAKIDWSRLDFNQHQLPIITRLHNLFTFPEQDYFIIAERRFSIEDMATAFYHYYEHNPRFVVDNLNLLISLEGP